MKSRDFVYWLQGFFEISEATSITEAQADMIRKHLDLVFAYEKTPTLSFVQWLSGFLDAVKNPQAAQVATIKTKLSAVFKHEVDPPIDAKPKKPDNSHPFQGGDDYLVLC